MREAGDLITIIINKPLSELTVAELEAEASRIFQALHQVQSELERRYDEVPDPPE